MRSADNDSIVFTAIVIAVLAIIGGAVLLARTQVEEMDQLQRACEARGGSWGPTGYSIIYDGKAGVTYGCIEDAAQSSGGEATDGR